MSGSNNNSYNSSRLREKAEEIIKKEDSKGIAPALADMEQMLHEFEVHRAELEIQNEELQHKTKEMEAARNEYCELFEAAPVGFVIIDKKGFIEKCNQAASKLLSSARKSMGGRLFSSRIHIEDREIYYSYMEAPSAWEKTGPTVRIVHEDGSIFHVLLEASSVNDPNGNFSHWRLALVDITQRRQYMEALENAYSELESRVRKRTAELEARSAQLARLTTELTLAEQRERKRLAEILHDHLQQILAGAKLHLQMLARNAGLENSPSYQTAYDLVKESIGISRSLSYELSPPVLYQEGFAETLHWLARWMKQIHKLKVEVNAPENLIAIQEEIRILLFQSIRELLFNTVKYSGTTSARVDLKIIDKQVRIVVSDAGTGFDPADLRENNFEVGFGLFSIRERLELIGGTFDLDSAPGRGTSVTLTVPMETDIYNRPAEHIPSAEEIHNPVENYVPALPRVGEEKIRVLIADDSMIMQDSLSSLLANYSDIEVAGKADHGKKAVDLARRLRPDVILMDINMPHMDGIEATRRISREIPGIRILWFSAHDIADQAATMEQAGAECYLNKNAGTYTLLSAIRGR